MCSRSPLADPHEEKAMSENRKSPFEKEPAEGSRETVERQLEKQERRIKRESVSGQQKDGATDRTREKENRD